MVFVNIVKLQVLQIAKENNAEQRSDAQCKNITDGQARKHNKCKRRHGRTDPGRQRLHGSFASRPGFVIKRFTLRCFVADGRQQANLYKHAGGAWGGEDVD